MNAPGTSGKGMASRLTEKRLLVEALMGQKLVAGNKNLAEELADLVVVAGVSPGTSIIEQGAADNELYLILVGAFDVSINGHHIARRGVGDHVGELAAIEPTAPHSATVTARQPSVVARLAEAHFSALGEKYPGIYKCIARELGNRQRLRNTGIRPVREKSRLFIISSVEGLEVARAIQSAFEHDPFTSTVWTDGVFRVAHYPLTSLEDAVEDSDFAIAIAHADDKVTVRGADWPAPRDNVTFELGLFMGRLGRDRAILMEPRDEGVKLPSDLAGITAIPYRFERGRDAAAKIAPACNALRKHIVEIGPRR